MTAPAPTGVALDRVVAVQATWPDGHSTFGSGFLVHGRLVLTAAHCIRDKVTGRLAASLQVVRPSDGAEADGGGVIACTQWDVAVIALGSDAPWQEQLARLVFARVDRRYSGKLENCEGIGFPLFQRDPQKRTRETSEVHGTIYPTDGSGTGRLLMRDPLIHPGPMAKRTMPNETGAAAEQSGPPSAWSGLSGALIFHGGMALGVVVDHNPGQGVSALQAVTFDAIAADPDPAARQVADALGLPEADQLPWAGSSRQRAAARRVVGDRISADVDLFRDRVTFRSDLRHLLFSRKCSPASCDLLRGCRRQGPKAMGGYRNFSSCTVPTGVSRLTVR